MSDSSDGRASRPFVAALLVTVFGTMCVSEQKQKRSSRRPWWAAEAAWVRVSLGTHAAWQICRLFVDAAPPTFNFSPEVVFPPPADPFPVFPTPCRRRP